MEVKRPDRFKLRDRLNQHQHGWDKEQLWSEIEQQLPKKRRRNPFLIWWLGMAVFPLGISVGFWLAATYFSGQQA
ncbi:MAG: hypothetical protein AAF242_20735 [Bacteroidota bacterium]